MGCLPNQRLMKLVRCSFIALLFTNLFALLPDKMKQYLEQLRKECSDRMVNTVIDSETDKPSKVCFSFEERNALH